MKFLTPLPFVALLFFVLVPDLVSASVTSACTPSLFVPCCGTDCSACHFAVMGNAILQWLIGALFVVFAVIAAIAGFGLVTSGGNEQAKSGAKSKLTNAIIGIVIVLAAWLLVDTILRALLPGNTGKIAGWGPWSSIKCTTQTSTHLVVSTPSNGASPNGTGLSEADSLSALNAAGISVVSNGGCTDPSNRHCTGVAGLQADTVANVVAIDTACPDCGIVITAGTETGHTNACHQAGTCVDIDCRPNECTVNQINNVDSSASSLGMNAVYEVKTQDRKDELVAAGVDPSAISVVSWITGEHFSLYDN